MDRHGVHIMELSPVLCFQKHHVCILFLITDSGWGIVTLMPLDDVLKIKIYFTLTIC